MPFKTENVQNFPVLLDYKGTITHFNIGRVHLPTPHTGPVSLHLRATKYHPSTIATHINNLHNILKEGKKAACIILSDGGPDYSPSNVVNSLFYFRLFQELNFDLLSVSTYAARYSAYNPIEHAWSPLSNLLAGVVFSPKLEGNSKPPCDQRNLSASEIKEKEYAVFDKAISDLAHCWENAEFNGYPVRVKAIICGEDKLKWGNYSTVKDFFKAPLIDLHKYKDLKNECKSMFRHLDRHSNEAVFIRYKDRSCCTEWQSSKLRDHLALFDFRLPAPVFGAFCDGHLDTFLQRLKEKGNGPKYGDEGQPTAVANRLEKCSICYSYKFQKSKTEQKRHVGMFHRRAKSAYKEPDFECLVCKKQFTSLAILNRHKTKEGHNVRKTAALVGSSELPKKR